MKRSVAVLAAFLLLPSVALAASATTYKCPDAAGKVVYSDQPCNPRDTRVGVIQLQIPELGPQGSRDLAREGKRISGEENGRAAVLDAIKGGKVIRGMTEDEVKSALGSPTRINDNGGHVQWVYREVWNSKLQRHVTSYVYFRNGLTH